MLRFFKRRHSLSILLLFCWLIIGMLAFVLISLQAKQDRRLVLETMTTVSKLVASVSRPFLENHNYGAVEKALMFLENIQQVYSCRMYSMTGQLLASYPPKEGTPVALLSEKATEASHLFYRQKGSPQLRLTLPLFHEQQQVAILVMISRHPGMDGTIWRSTVYAFVGACIVMLLLFFFIIQRMTRTSLEALNTSVKNTIKTGEFKQGLQGEFHDQIGPLAKTLDSLLTALSQRDFHCNAREEGGDRQHQGMKELEALKDEAVAAVEARGTFLAHMSHEIRTPLNGILGVLSILKDAPLEDEYRRLLETAIRSTDSLILILNDILDFSKIEAGKIGFENIQFDLRDIVEESVTLFIDMANSKGIELLCDLSTIINPYVVGDPVRLRQIITNLMGNAVKFTHQGEVVLRVTMLEEIEDNQSFFQFSVEDSGIGISSVAQKKIFERFSQAEDSTTRHYGGTGLGLHVCKQLVELQEGEIGLQSEQGGGTTFWFTLPLLLVEKEIPAFPCEALEKKNILIVDNNPISRDILEKYLKVCDAKIYTCDSADKALVLLRDLGRQRISMDILLIDSQLPGKNGAQLAEELQIIFGGNTPKMYLLSSERGENVHVRNEEIQKVIYKPVHQVSFYNALAGKGEIDQHVERTPETEDCSSSVTHLQGRVLLVDDEPVNQKVGGMLLKKMGLVVETAKSGKEAVQMVQDKVYDLLLMDLSMPEMNGFEATQEIRRIESEKKRSPVTIVALTANAFENVREQCLEQGMDDFIAKPIKPELLAERLQPWLPQVVLAPAGEKKQDSLFLTSLQHKGDDVMKIWDVEKALELVGGDDQLLVELICLFLNRKQYLMDVLVEAVQREEYEAISEAAHAYKGAVSHFSATMVGRLAQSIEDTGRQGDMAAVHSLLVQLKKETPVLIEALQKAIIGLDKE